MRSRHSAYSFFKLIVYKEELNRKIMSEMYSNDKNNNVSKLYLYLVAIIIFIFLFMGFSLYWPKIVGYLDDNLYGDVRRIEEPYITIYTIPRHTILNEFKQRNNDSEIVLEVLVKERESTKEDIMNLVKHLVITNDVQNIVIEIYQDIRAWEENKTEEHTEVFYWGYLAKYVKKTMSNGDIKVYSEIVWLQQEGHLGYLNGTKTEVSLDLYNWY